MNNVVRFEAAEKICAKALSTASYVRNRSPTTAVKAMTPYEGWKSYKPNGNHLRIFGCRAYAHIPKDDRSKMVPKAKKSIFLRYGIGVKGYRLFDTDTSKVFQRTDIIFNETEVNRGQKKLKISL